MESPEELDESREQSELPKADDRSTTPQAMGMSLATKGTGGDWEGRKRGEEEGERGSIGDAANSSEHKASPLIDGH